VIGDGGVGPAFQQRPHHPPMAPVARPPQHRRAGVVIAVVDGALDTRLGEQEAHDLEVASGRCDNQGSPAGYQGDRGVGPPFD
jgi:hypothetical protein